MSIDPECLLNVLRDDRSVSDLRTYFNIDHPHDPPLYTGARFEVLDGGGARDEVRDKITPWDLLALQCLSVTMPAPVALDLVEGPFGERINELLRRIPANVLLGESGAKEHVVDESPGWQGMEASQNPRRRWLCNCGQTDGSEAAPSHSGMGQRR